MNNQISFLNVVLGNEQQLGVNARDVHAALEVKSEFSHWINRRIKQCKFEENFDYILIVKKDEQVSGTKYLNEYIISLDMAKHLGMMERNEKGHEMRKYFIEQEKIARSASHSLQIEIGKAIQQIQHITEALSNSAVFCALLANRPNLKCLKN